jgi:hypothetical protein
VTAAGWNSEGQLGVGRNTESSSLPMAVPGMLPLDSYTIRVAVTLFSRFTESVATLPPFGPIEDKSGLTSQ